MGAGRVASVRGFSLTKLSHTLEYLDETWREGSSGQAAGDGVVFFGFCHQGAELLGAKGGKMGVFALNDGIFERNLEGREFWPSCWGCCCWFLIWPPGHSVHIYFR